MSDEEKPDIIPAQNYDENLQETLQLGNLEISKLEERRSYEGPLPLASEFKLYEEACEGAGNRILAMAERNLALKEKELEHAVEFTTESNRALIASQSLVNQREEQDRKWLRMIPLFTLILGFLGGMAILLVTKDAYVTAFTICTPLLPKLITAIKTAPAQKRPKE